MASLRVGFLSPVVCRAPGLSFSRVERFGGGPLERLEADRAALWAELDDPLVVDAFATMNPQALGNLLATKRGDRHQRKRNADLRRDERTLFMFLSRFATRNDTTGAAGSTFWGRFTPGEFGARLTRGDTRYSRRAVLVSPRRAAWLWQRGLEQGLWRTATVTRSGRFHLTPAGAWDTQSGGVLALKPEHLHLAATAPGQLAGEIASTEREEATLRELLELGVLRLAVRGSEDVLVDLLAAVRAHPVPDSFRAGVERLEQLRAALVNAQGVAAIEVMREAEEVARSLAPLTGLDLGSSLARVTEALLADPHGGARLVTNARLQPCEGGVVDTLEEREIPLEPELVEALRDARAPVFAAALRERLPPGALELLVRDQHLLFEGEAPFGPPPSLAGRFASRVHALLSASLAAQHAVQVRLLRDAWPLDGASQPPAVALGRLTESFERSATTVRTLKTDRSFFFEDTARAASLELGAHTQAKLRAALGPWFRMAGYIAWLGEQDETALLEQVLPPGQGLPLPALLSRLERARVARREARARGAARPPQDLSPLRFAARTPGVVELELGELPAEYLAWEHRSRLISVLDLMLAGPEGEGRWVINEAHALSAESLPLVTMFPHAQPPAVVDELLGPGLAERLFGKGAVVPDASAHSKQSEAILRQLADARVAVMGQRGPWWPPWLTPIDAAELLVARGETGVEVRHGGQPVPYASGELCSGHFHIVGYLPDQLAALAADAGFATAGPRGSERRPEVRMGDFTLVRASVLIDAAALGTFAHARTEATLLEEAARLRTELELPRFVFIKLSGKPFWCDFSSVFSLEVLAAELRAHQGLVTFSEMSPGPEALWLRFDDGAYTSELRFVVYADGEGCPLPPIT